MGNAPNGERQERHQPVDRVLRQRYELFAVGANIECTIVQQFT